MTHSGGDMNGIGDLLISIDSEFIVSSSYVSLERWDARFGEQKGHYFEVPGSKDFMMIIYDGEDIAWGSKGYS